jgi:hypothetical protein
MHDPAYNSAIINLAGAAPPARQQRLNHQVFPLLYVGRGDHRHISEFACISATTGFS